MSNENRVLDFRKGACVVHKETVYKIINVIDLKKILAVNVSNNKKKVLDIVDLTVADGESLKEIDINAVSDKDLKIAKERYEAIEPFIDQPRGRKEIDKRAKQLGVSYTSIYRWLNDYESTHTLEGLLPAKRGVKKGHKSFDVHTESIIKKTIEDVYLTKQRLPIKKVILEVKRRCLQAGIKEIPHPNTIRNRINRIDTSLSLKKRGYTRKAKSQFEPKPGKFPDANYPLSSVQIDHTKVDLILVDDEHRKPIGRPWVTFAIDVYSRTILGYYLTLEAPSVTSVAMCVFNAILPKDKTLARLGVSGEWPIWGMMKCIHVDNGSDFRAESFSRACDQYGIILDYRPIEGPQFGGHVERLIGSFMKEVHTIPGTTFSNIQERTEYDSEKNAVMTFDEFESWLVNQICNVYHKSINRGIEMTPLKKWEIGIWGDGHDNPGIGIPKIYSNERKLRIDFLPMFKRTIQRTGVSIDNITYYSDVLRHFVNRYSSHSDKKKIQYIFKRDPRDISVIWFYDPDEQKYFDIPYANPSLPVMSLWDYKKARKEIKRLGKESYNELDIIEAYEELDRQVETSIKKTKKIRREAQAKKQRLKTTPKLEPEKLKIKSNKLVDVSEVDIEDDIS